MLETLFCYKYINPSGNNRIINILKKKLHHLWKRPNKQTESLNMKAVNIILNKKHFVNQLNNIFC